VVISLDDWPTTYSVHSRCNEIIGLQRTEHCILATSQSEIGSSHSTNRIKQLSWSITGSPQAMTQP